jgi:hypothetical protein
MDGSSGRSGGELCLVGSATSSGWVRAEGRAVQEKNRIPKKTEAPSAVKKVFVFTVIYRRNSKKVKNFSFFHFD